MGTRWIRQASDTPNVSNTDDVRMIRYAYGYQDGILKNVGAQVAASASGSTFKLASGVIVLQGWELEIDANGWSMTVDTSVATKRYYAVYFEVNLAAQTAEIKSVYSTSGTPSVDAGADLSAQTTGTARLLLYTFSATSGVITEIVRAAEIVEPWTGAGFAKKSDLTSGAYAVAQAEKSAYSDKAGWADKATLSEYSGHATTATYASDDATKGTIEQRLTRLGFRSGSISADNISNTTLTRQGNYVIGSFTVSNSFSFTLPVNFRPKSIITSSVGNYHYDSFSRVYRGGGGIITFNTDGTVSCSIYGDWSGTANVCFGFEATAIT